MLKNARRYLVERDGFDKTLAPSCLVEGWLYNVPASAFEADARATSFNVLKWLQDNPDWDEFVCQNCQ